MTDVKAVTGRPHDRSKHFQENYNKRTQLNTYIYEYFLHNGMSQCAEYILKADPDVKVHRHSPSSELDDKGRGFKNALRRKPEALHDYCKLWAVPPTTSSILLTKRANEASQRFQMQLTSTGQQNKNELTTRQGRSGLSRNEDIAGSRGTQGPIRSLKSLQRPALQASSPDALSGTTKQVEIGIQPMNDIIVNHPKAELDCLDGSMGTVRMNDWIRASNPRTYHQSNGQTTWQPVAAKKTPFQQQGKIDHNWWVQWQNDLSENPIPWASRPGDQGTQQERSLSPSVKPDGANNSAKPKSTISLPSQTSKSALPTPQLSKPAHKRRPSHKNMTPKKRVMDVKDEMVTCKIHKSNAGSTLTHPANAAPNPVPHINLVGKRNDVQNTSIAKAVPTGQPAAALPSTPASMAANPPVDLVQSATIGMEISNLR
ncbi:hypothetical protein FLONG3_23 [Fusarium longipes]|uniref:LisH domain-containing protein n=1 Tax=Fusarium longipes TaxID=694270 RepID=A0A395TBC8_9HYPO|nr:hypothetical protein FLONG3_23 [Fusarium longipes]